MSKLQVLLAMLLFAVGVHAQMYKWVAPDGKVRYGDTPPPGVKATPIKGAQSEPARTSVPAPNEAKKGPMTPTEQDAKRPSEKPGQEGQAQAAKQDGCERARASLSTLESGQRIARTNPSGERYYLDENQLAREIAKAQQSVRQSCK